MSGKHAGLPCYGPPPDATVVARHSLINADHTSSRTGTNVASVARWPERTSANPLVDPSSALENGNHRKGNVMNSIHVFR
jgi:hypothetical protein